MFTKNNYILVKGKTSSDSYVEMQLDDKRLTTDTQIIATQLPNCVVTFPATLSDIERDKVEDAIAYQLVLENTQGKLYTLELIPYDIEVFCRYSKFKQMDAVIQWYQNFALVDWLGFPCKIVSCKEVNYTGPVYNYIVQDTNNFCVSGIIFHSRKSEIGDDFQFEDITF